MNYFQFQAAHRKRTITCSACGCMRRVDSPECLGCMPTVRKNPVHPDYPFHGPLPGLLIKQAE